MVAVVGAPNLKGGGEAEWAPAPVPTRFFSFPLPRQSPMLTRPPLRPLAALLVGGVLAGPAGLPGAAALAAPVPGSVVAAAPAGAQTPTPAQLQALEAALNSRENAPLEALLQAGPGLDPQRLLQRRQVLRQQFSNLRWQVRPGTPTAAGQATVDLTLTASRVVAGVASSLAAEQTLILRSDGRHLTGQTLLSESSLLRSGDSALPVKLQIPDAVLAGQSYDVDLIVEEPLDGALVAGALTAVSAEQVAAMESPPLELGALGGGGLFKTVRAPRTPGSQTWALLVVHPRAVISATKRVRVVADRRSLEL